jgi:type II secretion system protein J
MSAAHATMVVTTTVRTRARGFSLLEVLIAAALLAITGAFLATSLSSSIDAKEAVEATSGRYHVVRQGMTRMVDEISMAFLSAHNVTPELRVKTGFKGEKSSLTFTAFGHVARVEDAKESDQRELAYSLGIDDRTRSESIMRRMHASFDDDLDEGGREQTLIPGVTELEFEYWDNVTQEWKDDWDTESGAFQGRLPTRVKITFTAEMDNGVEQTFTTQTRVWLEKPWVFRT